MKVALKDIVNALEMQFDEYFNYLDRQTGKVEMVSRDELSKAEESEPAGDLPQSEEHAFDMAGAGAFRYLKDTLQRHRREKEWFAYREEALRQIAIDWPEENGIE